MFAYPKELLQNVNADTLKALARKTDLPKHLTRKQDIIDALAKLVETQLPELINMMSDVEQKVVMEAAHNERGVAPDAFKAKYGASVRVPSGWGRTQEAPLTMLLMHWDDSGRLRVPQVLLEPLRALVPEPEPARVAVTDILPESYTPRPRYRHSPEEPPRTIRIHESEALALAELRRMLRLIQSGKVKVADKSRRPTESAVRAISNSLSAPDFDLNPPAEEITQYTETAGFVRAHAWGVLVQQCGWAKPRAGVLTLTNAGKELLNGVNMEIFKSGVDDFTANDDFDEFNRIDHIRGQSGKGKRYMTDPSSRKIAISDSMAEWPVGAWLSFDEAYRFVFASGNGFAVTREALYLYFGELQYGHLSGESSEVNRQYLRALLTESMATLGIVDIAYVFPHWLWPELSDSWGIDDMDFCSRYDGLLSVRLNALGTYVLGLTDSYTPPAPVLEKRELFTVLPNLEIAITQGGSLQQKDVAAMALFAIQKNDHVWELNARQILDHLDAGGALEEIESFLTAHAANEIPANVQTFLRDVTDKTAVVQEIEEALLFQLKDAATAALIANDPEARKYCLLSGDCALAVPKKNQRGFKNALKKMGYLLPT